jgi:hypothetical protein
MSMDQAKTIKRKRELAKELGMCVKCVDASLDFVYANDANVLHFSRGRAAI